MGHAKPEELDPTEKRLYLSEADAGPGDPFQGESWEKRLAEARARREKVLAAKADAGSTKSSDVRGGFNDPATMFAGPEAQETPVPIEPLPARLEELPPIMAQSRVAETKPSRTLPMPVALAAAALGGAVCGSAVAVFLMQDASAVDDTRAAPSDVVSGPGPAPAFDPVVEPSSPIAATAPLPSDLRLVVITQRIPDEISEQLGAKPTEVRVTPFPILETAVHYFDAQDETAADALATRLGGSVVDGRGLQPAPPAGTLTVYLQGP